MSDNKFYATEQAVVVGNDQPHKQTKIAVNKLLSANIPCVSITADPPFGELHSTFEPGKLSESALKSIMTKVKAVVFASMYEGYGLPTAETARRNADFALG